MTMIATTLFAFLRLITSSLPDPGPALTGPAMASGWFDGPPKGGWTYLYGGTTEGATLEGSAGRKVLAYRGDDREYSGWTVHLPKVVDLSGVRKVGGVQLRLRSSPR